MTTAADLRRAESELWDHLANRVKAPWFVTTLGGVDRESRRPMIWIHVDATVPMAMTDAAEWVASVGGEWKGVRLGVRPQPGW